jgi:predicted DsbA family dithiol-disulfide isomerase
VVFFGAAFLATAWATTYGLGTLLRRAIREAIIQTYRTTGTTQAQLARDYGVDISTIKRLLRQARSDDPRGTTA